MYIQLGIFIHINTKLLYYYIECSSVIERPALFCVLKEQHSVSLSLYVWHVAPALLGASVATDICVQYTALLHAIIIA